MLVPFGARQTITHTKNMDNYTIVSMKWGTKYGGDYVNKLYNMARRNCTLPFKFVCFTDDASGLDKNIDARPLPPMDLPDGKERGWRKLSIFQKNSGLEGRVLFLDLDTVIVGNIDDFLTMDGKFIAIKHWKPSETQSIGETGVFRFEAGAHPDLFEQFMANMDEVKANNRHEQAYVISTLHKRGELSFWPEKWMPSFKYNCMRPFPLCFFQEPVLPEGAKMIVFHGNPTPDQAMRGEIKGIKKLFRHVITPKWLKENWR